MRIPMGYCCLKTWSTDIIYSDRQPVGYAGFPHPEKLVKPLNSMYNGLSQSRLALWFADPEEGKVGIPHGDGDGSRDGHHESDELD
eukprot:2580561-Rhodomonas_salina.3